MEGQQKEIVFTYRQADQIEPSFASPAIQQTSNTFAVSFIEPVPDVLTLSTGREMEKWCFHAFCFRVHRDVRKFGPELFQCIVILFLKPSCDSNFMIVHFLSSLRFGFWSLQNKDGEKFPIRFIWGLNSIEFQNGLLRFRGQIPKVDFKGFHNVLTSSL